MRRTRWAAALVIAVLGLTGCAEAEPVSAESDAPSASTSGTPAPPTGTVCDLLTNEAVAAFMGQPARVDEGNDTECVWLADSDGIYQLHLQVYTGRAFYAPQQWGTTEPVAGIGQEAFLVRQAVVGTVAGYWDGQRAVFLNYATLVDGGASAEKADELVLLLRVVAAHLG
jgi:uncharacterized protein DUF3558